MRQINLAFFLCDWRMHRLAEMAIPNGQKSSWTEVGVSTRWIRFRNSLESLEPLGQIDCLLWNRNHERTRPRNQKFSTPVLNHIQN